MSYAATARRRKNMQKAKVSKYILFGIGKIGKRLKEIIGQENIAYYTDNRCPETNLVYGIPFLPISKLAEIADDYHVIISVKQKIYQDEITDQLKKIGIAFKTFDEFYMEWLHVNCREDSDYYRLYHDEIDCFITWGKTDMIPYPWKSYYLSLPVELVDEESKNLVYTIYESKRLYLPRQKVGKVEYIRNLYAEQDSRSPHRYFDDSHCVRENEVFVDVGGAEALTSLEVVDRAQKIVIFEGESMWNEALHATFSPYGNKVAIVNKFVSNISEGDCIRVDDYFTDSSQSLFFKVDIEGAERKFLEGAMNILKRNNVRLSLCTYHNYEDACEFKEILEEMGYETRFTSGWIFARGDFVKGVLYAWRTNKDICS